MSDYKPKHFLWSISGRVGTLTLNRPEKKNPLTFESYAELRDFFNALVHNDDVRCVIVNGAGGNFCSGGDVHEIIGPLTKMEMPDLLKFTRMTGDFIKAIRHCPQVVLAAIDGICVGAGAAVAMACDLRVGTAQSKVGFLFTRVGLAGCDMGSCSLLPRIIGQGRAAELLFTGRTMSGEESLHCGFFNRLVPAESLQSEVQSWAMELACGPTFAHSMTKKTLNQEWNMSIDDAIDLEAEVQAICMKTNDFKHAYEAFVRKEKPAFKGE